MIVSQAGMLMCTRVTGHIPITILQLYIQLYILVPRYVVIQHVSACVSMYTACISMCQHVYSMYQHVYTYHGTYKY